MDPCDLNCTTTTRSLSTPISLLQSNPENLIEQFDSQPEDDVRVPFSDPASSGRKRRGRQPVVVTECHNYESKRKKNERDKAYRDRIKEQMKNTTEELNKIRPEYDRLMKIVSKFGGIEKLELQIDRLEVGAEMFEQLFDISQQAPQYSLAQKEAELLQFQQLKSRYGNIEEIESMLKKSKESEAELHKLEQMKVKFGEIEEMESMLEKFREIEPIGNFESKANMFERRELQHDKRKQTSQGFSPLPASPGSLHEQQHYGAFSMNLNNQGSTSPDDDDWMSLLCRMSPATATVNKQYSDLLVTQLIGKLNEEVRSSVSFSSFTGLDGERERVGRYSFPPSLASTVHDMIKIHGDITEKSFHGPSSVETTFILFAAAIKEMGDVLLKEVNEEHLFRWRDAIKDAMRSKFTVEFAVEHLKKIAYAYYGLQACNDLKRVQLSLTSSITEEKYLREQLERIVHEVRKLKDMEEELTSERCKMCQNYANDFFNKTVGLF